MVKLLLILCAIALYVKGECDTKWLGKSNKNWKLTLGIPIGLLGLITLHTLLPLLCLLTYLIAGEMPYGENHWWTKLIGKTAAITFCGAMLGIAAFPVLGYWAILNGVIGGMAFYWIHKKDDAGIIKEPYVALYRILATMALLLGA